MEETGCGVSEKENDDCGAFVLGAALGIVCVMLLGEFIVKPRDHARTAAACALYFRSAGDTEVDTLRVLVQHDECKHFYRAKP